ncbi:MAG: serine/threonine-protein kinase [Planctomycetota bacterium]
MHDRETKHLPSDPDPLIGITLGGYRIDRPLAKGGMGRVYRGHQLSLEREVAIKVLPTELAENRQIVHRFQREIRTLSTLSHPNIVSIFDGGYDREHQLYYYVMELIDGVTLREIIQQRALRPEEALALVPPICEALAYAHERGLVHRDIKPANLLLDKQGRVKIADFGLSRLLDEKDDQRITNTQQVMGTLEYMAPEQREGAKRVDHRADIYSLGVVIYEMLTGELPIGRFDPPSRKVQIDIRLDEVVLRVLEKDPARRYQQVEELGTDVRRISQVDGPPPPPRPKEAAPQENRYHAERVPSRSQPSGYGGGEESESRLSKMALFSFLLALLPIALFILFAFLAFVIR